MPKSPHRSLRRWLQGFTGMRRRQVSALIEPYCRTEFGRSMGPCSALRAAWEARPTFLFLLWMRGYFAFSAPSERRPTSTPSGHSIGRLAGGRLQGPFSGSMTMAEIDPLPTLVRRGIDDNLKWEGRVSPASVIGALLFGAVSVYFLVDGFRTGVMKCFVSIALQGEARRKNDPAWFWTWAGLNVLMVILAVVVVAEPLRGALFPCSVNRC